jgi:hypothetical protein
LYPTYFHEAYVELCFSLYIPKSDSAYFVLPHSRQGRTLVPLYPTFGSLTLFGIVTSYPGLQVGTSPRPGLVWSLLTFRFCRHHKQIFATDSISRSCNRVLKTTIHALLNKPGAFPERTKRFLDVITPPSFAREAITMRLWFSPRRRFPFCF